MTDRELLELAAKAAGIELRWHPDGTAYSNTRCSDYWGVWNPLRDDGDALRLAVKCNLWIGQHDDGVTVSDTYGRFVGVVEENHDNDPYAATRRAIVRVAAEIGKQMGGSDD